MRAPGQDWNGYETDRGWSSQNSMTRTVGGSRGASTHTKLQNAYLAQEQLKRNRENLPRPKHNPECLTRGAFPISDSPFTLEELNVVIGKQGNNKAPGTDNLRAELVKYLGEENSHSYRTSTIFIIVENSKLLCTRPQSFLVSKREILANWKIIAAFHLYKLFKNW